VLVLKRLRCSITGYISPTLSYPDPGPAVTGSWSGNSFSLHSEEFTTSLASQRHHDPHGAAATAASSSAAAKP